MIEDYGYVNARIRALQGLLLSGRGLETGLAAPSLEEFMVFLGSTPYAGAVAEAQTVTKGIGGVEEGLRRDFQHTIDHVVRLAGGRAGGPLALVLGPWELFNVKTVLRGLHARVGLERIQRNTVPFGRLDEPALKELARQGDVAGAIDLLVQWRLPWAPALRRAFPGYRDRNDPLLLETALDRGFFKAALQGLDPDRSDEAAVSAYLRREIDLILTGYALRVLHHGTPPADLDEVFIPGGRTVSREVFARLCAARTVGELAAALPRSPAAACLAGETGRSLEPRPLLALDRALRACFVRETLRLGRGAPLSIAFTIAFLWRKMNEVTNLRLIARGKYAGIPRAEIEALLVPAGHG
ncbi:MAG TPA: V-type ATPase subunit [Candidatus Methanoperedens sp.]|nr:V-type ATPase subunit [Candidatus Methanoperedens sp.]